MSVVLAATGSAGSGLLEYIGSSDYIYVRATEPFWGVFFELTGPNTGGAAPFQSVEYSATGDTWTSMTSKDSTLAFSQDGCLAFLPTADPYASDLWVELTVDSVAGYWIRIAPNAALAGVTIANVYLCPYRPAIDESVAPYSAQMLAGVLPKILVGTWGGERITWHDVWTLESARIMKMLIGRTRGSNSTGRLTLWAIAQDDVYHMAIGPEADPARAAWPATETGTHIQACSSWNFGGPAKVNKLVVMGEHLHSDDRLWLYWHWDNDDRWHRAGDFQSFPIVTGALEGEGRVLQVAWGLEDTSRDAIAPYVTSLTIPSEADGGWTRLEGEVQQPDTGSPQAT